MSGPYLLEDDAGFVVIGTGAGGATAARVLAGAGREVIMLEEGPAIPPSERPRELLPAMEKTFRKFGATLTKGPLPFPVLQGRLVGGSTAINSGIIWRLPEYISKDWRETHGLPWLADDAALAAAFDHIEKDLNVGPTAREVMGENSLLLEKGAKTLGYDGIPTNRNAPGCEGTGMCLQGCEKGYRQGMDVSYVPMALKAGARLHALCRATRVRFSRGRAVGVEGHVVDPQTRLPVGRFYMHARQGVIVAGGAIQTPVLLRNSGLKGMVGEMFQAHPGGPVIGRFADPVDMVFGATQGYQVPFFDRGFKLESLSLPPEMLATRLPGTGHEWQERLANLQHFAQWAVMVRMKARGRVRPGGETAAIHYAPDQGDLETFRTGVATAARIMFAAGATEVYHGLGGRKEVLTSMEEVDLLEAGPIKPRQVHLVATHLFGSARAGTNPKTSVVDERLEHHDKKGLFVMDASVFPTNIGVNPQHSIQGIIWRAAEALAARERPRAAA